ncbi:right-handed parallel beta-helix repeat-containing protein [Methanobrevibacter sp.]|uniref:right-handed parallel beta-helix repeat-containing protein n=1 Tax=Methanobrevibacter sp. TaxID=66852 RepID=UPI0026E0F44F|nr:right-handed parallel beta-helix repeat-containing protein [Methanobrevibacter sp.]MDO5860981.1 right-handed parallel beta-helix repeat-containing protein [Methanobrevibacter sp.]
MIIIFIILTVSAVSSTEIDDNSTLETADDNAVSFVNDTKLGLDEEIPDEPDLVLEDTVYVTSQNFDDCFENNVLKSRFDGKTVIFAQDFENLGKLSIQAKNVIINGFGHTLKNTVFELDAENITLTDLNINLDSEFEDNDYAGILIYSDYANLINLNINYVVPTNVQAYGIFASGSSYDSIKKLRILNNNIYFEGHNNDVNVYDVAVKLSSCENALVENNTISSSLPLKDIMFGAGGAELASDLVLTVGIEDCNNLLFIGNTLISEVNKRPEHSYPSLDCMMVFRSYNSLIANNSIYMTDFLTFPGVDNYLYGLDIYNLENLTAIYNNISIITTGGKLAAGTAYPIQITGPIDNVNITYNDLYSFSNGPNIGIYSQNFYGATTLSITHNRINVTGLAGTHEWALVAGIESQDTHSTIQNNIIEVHSVGDVSVDDNLYGVSYRQNTNGDHQYDIQNNTVFSDGYYSVNLLSSVNSTIANNLLVTYNPNAKNSNGYKYGDISAHENMEFYNNPVISAFDYFASRENNVDNGVQFNYNPFNRNDISNNVDGSRISSDENTNRRSYNPLIPGSSDKLGEGDEFEGWTLPNNNNENSQSDDGKDDSNSQGLNGDENGKSNGNSTKSVKSLRELLLGFVNSNTEGGKVNTTSYNGQNVNIVSNNSDTTPSAEGSEVAASQSKSTESLDASIAGESSSVSKKVYEIEEKNDEEFIPSIFFVIAVLILLVVGSRRKNSNLD